MELHEKIPSEGMRIGYLYNNASDEDKKAIDDILEKYHDLFPLIRILDPKGKSKIMMDIEEAKKLHTLFKK